jgi:MFS family permease
MLFLVTTVNYADRATLSIAGPAISKELHLDPIAMGYVFSAFGWSYVIAQVPGGWLLDRFGSRLVYAFSIIIWSLFTIMQGWVGFFGAGSALFMLFALRFLVGLAEAPSFPAMPARGGLVSGTSAAPLCLLQLGMHCNRPIRPAEADRARVWLAQRLLSGRAWGHHGSGLAQHDPQNERPSAQQRRRA